MKAAVPFVLDTFACFTFACFDTFACLSKLGSSDINSNLTSYVESFSTDAREIFRMARYRRKA